MFKPYDLVLVSHPDYKHAGEVISRPYPSENDHTQFLVQVRRVPGDPNTMYEEVVQCLKPLSYKVNFVHYAIVEGRGSFPVDMLRYDFAAPVNFKLEEQSWSGPKAILLGEANDALPKEWQGRLVIASGAERPKHGAWTAARWNSFMWHINPVATVKYKRGT